MSARDFRLASLASLFFVAAIVVESSTVVAQPPGSTQGGIVNPAAPTPAPSTPSLQAPQVGPNPVDAAVQPIPPTTSAPPASISRPPAATAATQASRNPNRNNNSFSPRLARAPFMLGDTLSPSLLFTDELGSTARELPQGGGATRSKIAENSSSLPVDRIIFNYNHFHNAIDENIMTNSDINRFTVGLEKTFLDQMASIEVRFPFVTDNDFVIPGDFTRNGSDAGNLAVTLKGVLTSDSTSLIAAGLTIDTPTGGGSVLTNFRPADPLVIDISNDAVHLAPFLGFLCTPTRGSAHQAFIQVDVPTNPNEIVFTDQLGGGSNTTELLEQTLLYLDYQYSRELYDVGRALRQRGCGIRRVLGMAEIHYTTSLEDSDVVLSGTPNNAVFEVSSAGNRIDVVNLTLGLQGDFVGGSQLRLGTVVPISGNDIDDRFYDFEFQAQLNIMSR